MFKIAGQRTCKGRGASSGKGVRHRVKGLETEEIAMLDAYWEETEGLLQLQ